MTDTMESIRGELLARIRELETRVSVLEQQLGKKSEPNLYQPPPANRPPASGESDTSVETYIFADRSSVSVAIRRGGHEAAIDMSPHEAFDFFSKSAAAMQISLSPDVLIERQRVENLLKERITAVFDAGQYRSDNEVLTVLQAVLKDVSEKNP